MDNINNLLVHETFLQREYAKIHAPMNKEMEFYECVRQGDTEKLRSVMTPLAGSGYGLLSDDELRNIKYHMIISVAMITRFCTEGGMDFEMAYSLSDLYINSTDKCVSIQQVSNLHESMVFDFTERMHELATGKQLTQTIRKCLDYIYEHLHQKIQIHELAEYVSVNPSHLARIFKEQMGVPPSEYITKKRIEAASNMLRYSKYSPIEIGYYLAFSSHSHFIRTFKRYMGITPGKYRTRYANPLSRLDS